ncbi:MAG TPA: riboflavin biosynthesis protein RibF [Bryobacteraceae bacterium]|nr:riboflavin biosynthesis protein RibF [Bryobacteraceae bacterium]
MKIYRSLAEVPADFGPSALTIGNFDGVHAGHRRILRRLKELADARGWKPSALTFDPHPLRVVAPDRAPLLMTSPERRAELMAEEGIQQVVILPFTAELSRLAPEDFVRSIVVGRLGARAVLVGDNFRFGHRHAGDVRLLEELGRRFGFITEVVRAVEARGGIVSSSRIRDVIRAGDAALASRLLEHAFALEGDVVRGRGVGSKETVPTLNLAPAAELLPATGVYVTRTTDLEAPERSWDSITNVGYRPTFGASEDLSVETFLLTPMDGEAPRRIRVEFLWRVREERKFVSAEALRERILKDAAAARRYFRRTRAWIGQVPCASS